MVLFCIKLLNFNLHEILVGKKRIIKVFFNDSID